MTKELDDLKQRNEELEVRIAMLENQLNPKPLPPSNRGPVDYTEGFSMPRNAMQAMADAIPSSVMRGIAEDARKPNPITGHTQSQPQSEVKRGTGWRDEAPLSTPYVKEVDRLVDHQDRLDQAERAYAIAKARMQAKGK